MSEKDTPHSPDNNTDKGQPITFERVLDVLEKGCVSEEHGLIRWSSNYTLLLTVTHEDTSVLAVYKPQRGERPLWDFPDGTLCHRERAAFLVSTALDWRIVPPTVLRDGPRGIGSMQFFIEHDPEYNYFSFDASLRPQLERVVLFDAITNNADRKGGHCIVDSQNHLWGIDQGLTFNVAHKLRTVIWEFAGQPIPKALLADVEKLCVQVSNSESELRRALSELLSTQEINTFDARINRILKTGKFPKPGPGPNYPWPPV